MYLRILLLILLGSACANGFAVEGNQHLGKPGLIEQVEGDDYILSALDRDGEKKSVRATLKSHAEQGFLGKLLRVDAPEVYEFDIKDCGLVKFYRASRKGYARADYDQERSSDGDDNCLVSLVSTDVWLIK